MKKQIINLSLILLSIIVISSCSSSDDSDNNINDGQLTLTIDGEEFTAEGQNVAATLFNGTFNLTTINPATGETIVITVSNASESTFDLGAAANAQNGAVYVVSGENAYGTVAEGGSGQLNITKLDEENLLTSGNFEFIAVRSSVDNQGNIITETVTITNGSFSNLTLTTEIPSGGGNNSFSADIDGEALNPNSITSLELTIGGNTTIFVTATNNSTAQSVSLTFPGDPTVGTHELSSFSGDYTGSYNPSLGGGTNLYTSNPGTVTITSYDAVAKTMEGTFEFTAKRLDPNDPDITYIVSNGEFSVAIQ
ncbi:MAG: DUF6252 family protein [Flavobacteriaceae bacterium]|nr:DUF6252 family protein [Flavobacteriaceae bacterium]